MKKTIVYLIRHGELDNPKQVVYGRTIDLSLSQEGGRQIEALVDIIKKRNESPIGIYSSPLRRTIQTAEIVSKGFNNAPIFIEDDLNETASLKADGMSLSLFTGLCAQDQKAAQKEYGVEDFSLVAQRMKVVFQNILKRNTGNVLCIVSHGDPLALLFWHLRNSDKSVIPSRAEWSEEYLEKGESWRLMLSLDGTIEGCDHIHNEVEVL